jgi:SAM-dependent methyltransferase
MALLRTIAAVLALACAAAAGAADLTHEDVPFVTTPDRVTLAMLELAAVRRDDRLVDLGSGDGRIVITAARRFGARGLGVEIDPELVRRSREAAERAGVADRAAFREQDLFATELAGATVITMYLLPDVNLRLRPRLLALAPGTRIVSHDWDLGEWLPDRTLTLDVPEKTLGRDKRSRVHLWIVPAALEGLWCGTQGRELRVGQRFQQAWARAIQGARDAGLHGRIDGEALWLQGSATRLRLRRLDGDRLRVQAAGGALGSWQGLALRRAADPSAGCPVSRVLYKP